MRFAQDRRTAVWHIEDVLAQAPERVYDREKSLCGVPIYPPFCPNAPPKGGRRCSACMQRRKMESK